MMRRALTLCCATVAVVLGLWFMLAESELEWAGIDESVVERMARDAGREPGPLLLDTDRGDLLLFFFLIAGASGGFVAGYVYRGLFKPSDEARQ